MPVRAFRFVCALALIGFVSALCPGRGADDANEVRSKLLRAKTEYEAELQKFNKAVTDALDKREEAARKAGDKKAVDAAKAQRKAFEDTGALPAGLPAPVLAPFKAATAKLDKAHTTAVKALLVLKEDAAAETVEAEQQRFFFESAQRLGKSTYLVSLRHSDVKVANPDWFSNNGTINGNKIKKGGEFVPHSVFMIPPAKGSAQVKYALDGKQLAFRADVGVPAMEDSKDDPSPITFEVLGDGKSLWKSKPVTKMDTFQTCVVRVEKVRALTLLVHAPDKADWARAVWFEPTLIE